MTKIKNTYKKREFRYNPEIKKHKKHINILFSKKCSTRKLNFFQNIYEKIFPSKTLVVDSFKQQSRNTLREYGIKNNNIHTVDLECEKPDKLRHNIELKEYCEKTPYKYTNVFADVISNSSNSINQVKPLFEQKKLNKGGVFAITACLRGESNKNFSFFDINLRNFAKKYGYILNPIKVPKNLVLKTKGKTKYKIEPNMTDNASHNRTGRTVTAFYNIN